MAFEMKEKTFSLFENDKKGNDRAPDYKGKGLINGEEVKIAVWKKTGKTGVEYWSGVIEEPVKTEPAKEEEPTKDLGDEVPF